MYDEQRLEEIEAQQEVIRARLRELEQMGEPDGDEVTRSQTLADWAAEVDELTDLYDELEEEAQPLRAEREQQIARARRREEILAAARAGNRTESGDGSSRRGPEVMQRVDPWDTDPELVRSRRLDANDVISRAKKAAEIAPRHLSDEGRHGIISRLDEGDREAAEIARHMLLTGSPEYHEQFREFIASCGKVYGPEIARAVALSPDTAGGALVPFTLDPTIILANAGIEGSIRSLATIKQITTDSWNGVTSQGVTAGWLAEGAAGSDNSPSFAQPTITPHKAHAWVVGTYEVLADSNFASQLGMLIADAKVRLEETAFAVGTGSGQPWGVVTRANTTTASRVMSGTDGAFSAADVYNISAAASPRHASRSVWLANKSVYHQIRQFATVTTGGTFWSDMGVGRPSQLIGAATYEASAMSAFTTSPSATLLALVDLGNYYIVDRVGLTLKYVDVVFNSNTAVPTGHSGWQAYWRVGADLIAPEVSARVFRATSSTAAAAWG